MLAPPTRANNGKACEVTRVPVKRGVAGASIHGHSWRELAPTTARSGRKHPRALAAGARPTTAGDGSKRPQALAVEASMQLRG